MVVVAQDGADHGVLFASFNIECNLSRVAWPSLLNLVVFNLLLDLGFFDLTLNWGWVYPC